MILHESTRMSKKFYCAEIPLVDHNFKWKLARLSISLAYLTLSTDPEFTTLTVTDEHVQEVVSFLEQEYTQSGLATQAKVEEYESLDESEASELVASVASAMGGFY